MMLWWPAKEGAVPDRRIPCPGEDGPQAVGEATALRILPYAGSTFFLDFLYYSPALQSAELVGRLRVHQDTLRSIRERLSSELLEAPDEGILWASDIEVN